MTRHERNLLLYFESCAVDYNGRVNAVRMNEDDMMIADGWNLTDFVKFGRIKVCDHNSQGAHWAELSDDAWRLAHEERRARHARGTRRYRRTGED